MSRNTLKFNSALDVLKHLDQDLPQKERDYYFKKLRSSGGFEGVEFLNKESNKEMV